MKKILILYLFTLPLMVYGRQCQGFLDSGIHSLKEIEKEINAIQNLIDPKKINSRNCFKKVPSLKEMQSYLYEGSFKKEDRTIHGIHFKNENPELLDVFEKLTSLYQRNKKSLIEEEDLDLKCQKVRCMVNQIWGKQAANKILYLYKKYRINASELANGGHQALNQFQLDDIISAVEAYPKNTFNMKKDFMIGAFPNNKGDTALHEDGTIKLFPSWSNSSPVNRQYILFHEMAHYLHGEFECFKNHQWNDFSWDRTKEYGANKARLRKKKNAKFITEYAKTNPKEDLAESVVAYRYDAKKLKKLNPEKYQYIKEIFFGGIEYLNEESCKNKQSYLDKIANDKVENVMEPADSLIESVVEACSREANEYIVDLDQESFSNCVGSEYALRDQFQVFKDKNKLKYPGLVKKSLQAHRHLFGQQDSYQNKIKKTKKYLRNSLLSCFEKNKKDYTLKDYCKKPNKKKQHQLLACNNISLQRKLNTDQMNLYYDDFFKKACSNLAQENSNFSLFGKSDLSPAISHMHVVNKAESEKILAKLKKIKKRKQNLMDFYEEQPAMEKVQIYLNYKMKLKKFNTQIEYYQKKLYE